MRSRNIIKGWKHAAIAAALAYALVLQTLLIAFGGAAHAAAALEGQTLLCIENTATGQDPQDAARHDGLCCVPCGGGQSATVPPPAQATPERLLPTESAAALPAEGSVLAVSSNVLPVGSRAPPRLG